jgi:3-deoxy-D-arabino-heptulosonate 7-phosphate (DAHP) synthase
MSNSYFANYGRNLQRYAVAQLIDEHLRAQEVRKLSIVGPCLTHEQWAAAHVERKRLAGQKKLPTV